MIRECQLAAAVLAIGYTMQMGCDRPASLAGIHGLSRQRCCAILSAFVHLELYRPRNAEGLALRPGHPTTTPYRSFRSGQSRQASPGPEQKVNNRGQSNRPAG